MKKCLKHLLGLTILVSLGFYTGLVYALPSAELSSSEISLGGGLWEYDFTFNNTSDAVSDPGVDLYDVVLHFSTSANLITAILPSGWDQISGTGFIDSTSQDPGEPPAGTDIPPGGSLSGFAFQFDTQIAQFPFDALLVNPDDPFNPFPFSDISVPVAAPSSVPEPATFLLCGCGLAGLMARRMRFKEA